jgi:predicted cupin superfamily sugar epimerase
MDYVDQRAVMCVAGGVVAGALIGAHLKGMSWCPALWGASDDGKSAGSVGHSRSTKEEFISQLGMIPHPEGGFFVETYRSGSVPMTSRGLTDKDGELMTTNRGPTPERNVMTSIYYMLTAERPHQDWVNNMSDHVHYHHAGGTLIYNLVLPDGTFVERRLGTNVAAGDEPQLVVKGGTLKSVRLEAGAEFGLLGEGVAPGFDFRDFKWVTAKELKALSPGGIREDIGPHQAAAGGDVRPFLREIRASLRFNSIRVRVPHPRQPP